MKARIASAAVECLVRAAADVLNALGRDAAESGALSMRSGAFTTQEFNIVVPFDGDLAGHVILGMSRATASRVASAMRGQVMVAFDETAKGALAELGDRIGERAAASLRESGYECKTASVAIIQGYDAPVCATGLAAVVPLYTDFGRLEVQAIVAAAREGPAPVARDGAG